MNNKIKRVSDLQIVRKKLTMVSLFSGVGGFDEGAKQAGFQTLLATDLDKHSGENFALNHTEANVKQWDLFEKTGDDILAETGLKPGELDLLHASPPCVDASVANPDRDVNSSTNELFWKVTPKIIGVVKPRSFTIENVDAVTISEFAKLSFKLIRQLNLIRDENGNPQYVFKCTVLNSLDYSTPTQRRRFCMIGIRRDVLISSGMEPTEESITFPEPTTTDYNSLRVERIAPWIKWIYSDRKKLESKKKSSRNFMYTTTRTKNIMVRDIENVKRWLTKDELKMFNGFPLSYIINGSLDQVWARIGNAVSPTLAYYLTKYIRDMYLDK